MAFALFYEEGDLRSIATQLTRIDLPNNLANTAATFWDGGFKDWKLPYGPPYDKVEGDPFIEMTVVQHMQLSAFRDLLYAIAAQFPNDPNAEYMHAIADDINSPPFGDNSAAVEPWSVG